MFSIYAEARPNYEPRPVVTLLLSLEALSEKCDTHWSQMLLECMSICLYWKASDHSLSEPTSWWCGGLGNLQGGTSSVSQVDGVFDMAPAYLLCGERTQKRNRGFYQKFCLEESFFSSHLNARYFSFFLYIPGWFWIAPPALELRGSESEYIHLWALL